MGHEYFLVFKDTVYQQEVRGHESQGQTSAPLKPCVCQVSQAAPPPTPTPYSHLSIHTLTLQWLNTE